MVLQNPSPWPSSFEPLWFSPKSGEEEGAIEEEKGGQAVIAEDSSSSSESGDELADLDPLDLFWKVVNTSEEAGGGAALEELRESVPEGALDVTFGQGTGRTTPLHEAIRMMNTAAGEERNALFLHYNLFVELISLFSHSHAFAVIVLAATTALVSAAPVAAVIAAAPTSAITTYCSCCCCSSCSCYICCYYYSRCCCNSTCSLDCFQHT